MIYISIEVGHYRIGTTFIYELCAPFFMVSLRLILPALLFLSLGLILWVDPLGSATALLPVDSIPGGAPSVYILLIIAGILLGGTTLHKATREPRAHPANEEDPEPIVIKRDRAEARESDETSESQGLGIQSAEEAPKTIIRPLRITGKQDISLVQELLRDGPHVLFLNIGAVKNNADLLRQWLRIIEHTANANGGKVLGVDAEHVLATSGVMIVR